MEVKKINAVRVNVLEAAVRVATYDKDFDIYEMPKYEVEQPKVYGINWSATGTQDVATTISFANDLVKAAKLVNALNEASFEKVWDTKDEVINTREAYEEAVASLADNIKYAWAYSNPDEMDYVCSVIKQFVEAGEIK